MSDIMLEPGSISNGLQDIQRRMSFFIRLSSTEQCSIYLFIYL